MAIAISVRLDDESERALARLEAKGMSRSEAIRSALLASEKQALKAEAIRAEMAALEDDQEDREEMRLVAEMMEALRAEG